MGKKKNKAVENYLAKHEENKKNGNTLWQQFKKFISRGNIIDMAVGVIMGGAFNTLVSAFTKILMSVCTWGVPGGINGLVTVLPAANPTQAGAKFIIDGKEALVQKFSTAQVNDMTVSFAAAQGVNITVESDIFIQWKTQMLSLYTLHGQTYTYNMSSIIDWGTLINAFISFLIIALTLFVIVKVVNTLGKYRAAFQADMQRRAEILKQAQLEKEKTEEASEERSEETAE